MLLSNMMLLFIGFIAILLLLYRLWQSVKFKKIKALYGVCRKELSEQYIPLNYRHSFYISGPFSDDFLVAVSPHDLWLYPRVTFTEPCENVTEICIPWEDIENNVYWRKNFGPLVWQIIEINLQKIPCKISLYYTLLKEARHYCKSLDQLMQSGQ